MSAIVYVTSGTPCETPIEVGETIRGRDRLTDKTINKLQNYYSLANSKAQVQEYQLKEAIGAVLFHCSEASNLDTRHQMCQSTKDSWCKYKADTLN